MTRPRQTGAALLAAMLTVTLVATLASAALWQQWRGVEVEASERMRLQAAWVLTGAQDWGRLILREDARNGGADHLNEPWAVPLQEARLSTFLAADRGAADATGDNDNVFLSGQIIDMQGRLNLNNLVEAGKISEVGLRSFQRLFELLGLPQAELNRLAENLRFASDINIDNQSAAQAPLMPQRVEQLAWLGLSPATIAALTPHVAPFVALLPRYQVNINTASAEVIYAAINGITLADAQELVARRAVSPYTNLSDASRLMPQYAAAFTEGTVGVNSRYFEVRGRLRLDRLIVEERSLVRRDGLEVRTLARERAAVDPALVMQAGTSR
ncbi:MULTISPECIES: type II secretion system minor pseudopilin GspK [Ramlibacter]|uniref:Type II secretion system protein K n=1 Tax=Ramlibacter pinisoli TaxID=2682844 RepID=A0A6N8ITR3_9BURK|nr:MULTISPECIES: type II secretion system minor pseudopilin GspK [Ramlibacter]MBA2965385.1 type II secretion system minor pseudopilin GspK [Ramlibacter sp. CGMCC 1.13660]MVQ30349.1 type II secretion system minor pseudopilin GspK [Ramlibacter pinisoli]